MYNDIDPVIEVDGTNVSHINSISADSSLITFNTANDSYELSIENVIKVVYENNIIILKDCYCSTVFLHCYQISMPNFQF